jgi:hypothetical protein
MKPRLSLLTIILLMSLIAMALGLWQQHLRIAPLQARADRLEAEIGVVQVEDPNRFYASHLLSSLDVFRHVRFRVYVPEGRLGQAVLRVKAAGAGRTSEGVCTVGLPVGRSTLEFYVNRDAAGDEWEYQLRSSDGGGSIYGSGPMPPWFADDGSPLGMRWRAIPPEGLGEGESWKVIESSLVRGDGTKVDVVLEFKLDAAPPSVGTAAPVVP